MILTVTGMANNIVPNQTQMYNSYNLLLLCAICTRRTIRTIPMYNIARIIYTNISSDIVLNDAPTTIPAGGSITLTAGPSGGTYNFVAIGAV
jgi:hypothetical protein